MSPFARKLQLSASDNQLSSLITHGSQVNATNTGIAGVGVARASLTATGSTIYGTSGQTISGRLFTGTVTLNGNNITLERCQIETNGMNTMGVIVNGTGCVIQDVTIVPPSSSTYICININADDTTVRRVNASVSENIITVSANNVLIEESYLHDTSNLANPSAHQDIIEVYGGSNVTIRKNRLFMHDDETAAINIAPWWGSSSSDNVWIDDNWIDGGNAHILVDLQSTGTINGTRVRRNHMAGHTAPGVFGRYAALQNNDNRTIVQTEGAQGSSPGSILWPTSGPDANYWQDCSDLSPDQTGQIVIP